MDREDKRGIFFGVIGVLTLIVAIIGASLAYFSINANSAEDALIVESAKVQIVYNDGDQLLVANGIIPSSKEDALETYRRYLAGEKYDDPDLGQVAYEECIDDNGYTVCGVYEFTLTNNGGKAVNITANVVPTALTDGQKGFTNLKFSLYDITNVAAGSTDSGVELTDKTGVSITYDKEGFSLFSDPVSLAGDGNPVKYRLFIWLDETGKKQDDEQGAIFKGTVHIDVPSATNNGQITGDAEDTLKSPTGGA